MHLKFINMVKNISKILKEYKQYNENISHRQHTLAILNTIFDPTF